MKPYQVVSLVLAGAALALAFTGNMAPWLVCMAGSIVVDLVGRRLSRRDVGTRDGGDRR